MSGGVPCTCDGFHKAAPKKRPGSAALQQAYREKNWRVVDRMLCNYSAFSGYHYKASDYSCVTCLVCKGIWRTKAAYVSALKNVTDEEFGINRVKD